MNETIPATGRVLARQDHPGGYTLLRVTAKLETDPRPGHALRIDGQTWPVLQSVPEQGWVDCLQRDVPPPAGGTEVSASAPLGEPFDLDAATPRALLLADRDGIAPIVFRMEGAHPLGHRHQPGRDATAVLAQASPQTDQRSV